MLHQEALAHVRRGRASRTMVAASREVTKVERTVAATELVAAVPPAGGRCGAGRGVHGCTLAAAGVGVPAGAVLREQRCAGEGASRHVRVPNRNGVTCVAGKFLRSGQRPTGAPYRPWVVVGSSENPSTPLQQP